MVFFYVSVSVSVSVLVPTTTTARASPGDTLVSLFGALFNKIRNMPKT